MRVIPVIDLLGGQVVRGIAGRRELYRPIQSRIAADAQPATVARAFVEQFGFETVYVADLDAIISGRPNLRAWSAIHDAGLNLWLDAGVGTTASAASIHKQLANSGSTATMIVALESLVTPLIVVDLVSAFRSRYLSVDGILFSLDLKQGVPLSSIDMWTNASPIEIVRWIVKAGIERLLILDLANVGIAQGTSTIDLCRQVRREFGSIELIAGGGVRGLDDLKALADAGCDAALVASALHDGRLTYADVQTLLAYESPR